MATDIGIRYVTKSGADGGNGFGVDTAKITCAAGVTSMPNKSSGAQAHRSGLLMVGGGLYTETTTPIEYNRSLRIEGTGIGDDIESTTPTGTSIRLGSNTHLFAPSAAFEDWAHFCIIKNVAIEGTGITGSFDLIAAEGGGFNFFLEHVAFRQWPRYGLRIDRSCSDFTAIDVTTAGATTVSTPFFYHAPESASELGNIRWFGFQGDNSGATIFHIDNNSSGELNHFGIWGVKVEATSSSIHHADAIIKYTPNAGCNKYHFTIEGMSAWRDAAYPSTNTTRFLETAGAGGQAYVNMVNVMPGGNTQYTYRSVKLGLTSILRNYVN